MIGTLEIIIIFLGLVGVPLACGIFCLWFDHSMNYIDRACKKASESHHKWERRQERKRK